MDPYISYIDKKNKRPIPVIGRRHQVDHKTPKKIQQFEEFITDPASVNAKLFVILIRHRQNEMISDGKKVMEIEVIKKY